EAEDGIRFYKVTGVQTCALPIYQVSGDGIARACQARLASTRDAISRLLVGLHLGDQEYAVALTGRHATNELLGAAVAVITRRIDQRHAERNACAQRLFLNS